MPTTLSGEIAALAWGCVLAFVHILVTAQAKTRQYGTKWNISARDGELPPLNPVAARLARAQANFFETFPIFIAAVFLSLLVSPGQRQDAVVALGGWLWLGGRVAYLPLYAFGVPVVRSLAWIASVVGIVMVMYPALKVLL